MIISHILYKKLKQSEMKPLSQIIRWQSPGEPNQVTLTLESLLFNFVLNLLLLKWCGKRRLLLINSSLKGKSGLRVQAMNPIWRMRGLGYKQRVQVEIHEYDG